MIVFSYYSDLFFTRKGIQYTCVPESVAQLIGAWLMHAEAEVSMPSRCGFFSLLSAETWILTANFLANFCEFGNFVGKFWHFLWQILANFRVAICKFPQGQTDAFSFSERRRRLLNNFIAFESWM